LPVLLPVSSSCLFLFCEGIKTRLPSINFVT
jgi:hypothetical protein